MKIFKLVLKNLKRHKLRLSLTILGIAIAVMAFGLLKTVVTAWYAGADASANNRVISRHAVSFIFPLPLSYRDKIAGTEGVTNVTWANWFSGVYIDKNQFFPRMAVDPETFFDVYDEFKVEKSCIEELKKKRNACIVGIKTVKQYNLKIGDIMNMDGDIYPGKWAFEIVGIYHGTEKKTDETQMLFNWNYLNENLRQSSPGRANNVGWYVFKVKDVNNIASISEKIDNEFSNSFAKTKTESEQSFNQSFISMSGAILTAMEFVSYVIIGILFLILGNTMVMSARERIREYAVLKTLGFTNTHLTMLIGGEAMAISLIGGAIGIAITFPMVGGIAEALSKFFPVFYIANGTLVLAVFFSIIGGVVTSIFPISRALKMSIVDGLRHIG